jgi:hypothetical protein
MAPIKGNFWEYLFTPLDFSCILGSPHHLYPWVWMHHVPIFWGQPHLASMHLSSFMKFIIENNIVHEDVLMKIFIYL